MTRDVRDLLTQASPRDAGEPDLDRIERRAGRRRGLRRAGAGAGAVALLVAVAVVVPQLGSGPARPTVDDPVDEPAPSSAATTGGTEDRPGGEAEPSGASAEAVALGSVFELADVLGPDDEAVVVGRGDRTDVVPIDGRTTVTLAGWDPVIEPGLAWSPPGPVTLERITGAVRPVTVGAGQVDVSAGVVALGVRVGALRSVASDPAPMLLRDGARERELSWPGGRTWTLSADRSTVTYCPDGAVDCDLVTYDARDGAPGTTAPGCHVADASLADARLLICGAVLSLRGDDGAVRDREPGRDGTWSGYASLDAATWPAMAMSADDPVLAQARVDCGGGTSTTVVLRGGKEGGGLQPLGVAGRTTAARLLGWTGDGRVVLRTLATGCGVAAGDVAGRVLVESDAGWRELARVEDTAVVLLHRPTDWMPEQEVREGVVGDIDPAGELSFTPATGGGAMPLPLAREVVDGVRTNAVGVTAPGLAPDASVGDLIDARAGDAALRSARVRLHLVDGEVVWIHVPPSG